MLTERNIRPGIYKFVIPDDAVPESCYRRYGSDGFWGDSATTIEVARLAINSFSQGYYWSQVARAVSVTLVAKVDGSPVDVHPQLDLFQ